MIKTLWWEPLVHFLALGALLFLVFNWRGGGAAGSNRIVLTAGQIDALAAGFARTWQRPPTDEELKGLLDDYVREEMATRDAMAMGLDRDDTIIRRRLRQKLEFVAEEGIDTAAPSDAELQAWLDRHPDKFSGEPEVAFRQVYLDPGRHGRSLEDDGRRLLSRMAAVGPNGDLSGLGDTLMVPHDVERSTHSEVARQFGAEFADAILKVQPSRWVGPLDSGYGLHLVYVRERLDPRKSTLADVRPLVEREYLSERRRKALDSMYEEMLARYRVTLERRTEVLRVTDTPGNRVPGASK